MKTWPRLTELQLAVLAAVRDNEVQPFIDYKVARFVHRPLYAHRSHGYVVTRQIQSLRKRHLIKIKERYREGFVFELAPLAAGELAKHPEF